jgi:diguanylate cyclase (GGDEF)-like protein
MSIRSELEIQEQLVRSLRDHERELVEAQRLTHLGTWAWDTVSGELTWSDELYRIFGLSREEFTPSCHEVLRRVRSSHRARSRAAMQAALVDGEPCAYECPITLSSGAQRWIRTVGVVDVAPGAPVRMHGTAQDITDFGMSDPAAATLSAGESALHDPLTGLANWHLFANRTAAALARATRDGSSTALLIIDIDQLHDVNDQFGHETGDLVLVDIAQRIDGAFRSYDTIGRLPETIARVGGDEFMVLCEQIDDAAVLGLCNRVADLLEAPVDLPAGEVSISAAVGAALALPGGADVEALVVQAESAMRRAKQRGRGAHAIFARDGLEVDGELGQAGRALQHAFEAGELRLYYQPKVALDSDRIVGAEALARWHHPERGIVPPLEFIPIAEETGLIVPIGSWVIEEACREAARWQRSFPDRPVLVVSVNLSARQFGPGLVDVVARALAASATDPAALCLEVTESLLMGDVEGSVAMLRELASLGVSLSIDDFGTGYSSLAHLKRFPLDELKIDKSFVDGLGTDDDDTAIVAAVVAMAHALQLSVVAEGVETALQLERLRTLGCEQAQGYLFGRPGPPETIDVLLSLEASASRLNHGLRAHTPSGAATYRPDRILLIDSDADVRRLALISLTAVGFEVHEAVDGVSALTAAKGIRPDCVLLDLVMPDLSGLEICRALRADPGTAECTILILTSNDGAAEKVDAFSSGADDYITKPFSPRDLASRVHAAMRRRREAADRLAPTP